MRRCPRTSSATSKHRCESAVGHPHLPLVLADSPNLSATARRHIQAADRVFVSAASIWEATIKASIGKLHVEAAKLVEEIEANGFEELPVTASHAALVGSLPMHHRDPFDRLLIAQSIHQPLRLLTADSALAVYSSTVEMV